MVWQHLFNSVREGVRTAALGLLSSPYRTLHQSTTFLEPESSLVTPHTSNMDCSPCWPLGRGSAAFGAGPLGSATAFFHMPLDCWTQIEHCNLCWYPCPLYNLAHCLLPSAYVLPSVCVCITQCVYITQSVYIYSVCVYTNNSLFKLFYYYCTTGNYTGHFISAFYTILLLQIFIVFLLLPTPYVVYFNPV